MKVTRLRVARACSILNRLTKETHDKPLLPASAAVARARSSSGREDTRKNGRMFEILGTSSQSLAELGVVSIE